MAQEIEHKYLVRSAVWRKQAQQGEHYRQGYLCADPERSVRVRAGSKRAFLTIKTGRSSGQNGLSRGEFEYPIPLEDANQLLDGVSRKPLIEKTRYRVPQNGHVWEIDRFEKENDGLVIAELETSNGETPKRLPSWIGEEVSKDDRYTNANLVEHPYSEWRAEAQKPDTKYHWKAYEGVSEGLQRIVLEQLRFAIWQISARGASLDDSVHDARKSLKKARSAMRLFRSVLGHEFGKANAALRDAGRKLSPVRDAQALIEIFDELNRKYREKLGDQSLVAVRDGLVSHKQKLAHDFHQKRVTGKVLKSLRDTEARVEKWALPESDFQPISYGFERTIRRNRKACKTAYADSGPLNFHEWRKRAKDLRYHLSLLSKAWPPVFDGYEAAAKDLEQNLGDDHNLVVLRDTILEKPGDFGKAEEISAFLKIVDEHQQQLRSESKPLAHRLCSETPKEWRRRIDRCWAAWKQEHD